MERLGKGLIATIVVLAAWALFLMFGFYITADVSIGTLLTIRDDFRDTINSAPFISRCVYFSIYVIVTSLSLPGALIMTLLGGAFFGLYWGTLLVSFASSIGATIAFLFSRRFLQNWVQHRYPAEMKTINTELKKDGALYLFGLRMVPVIPFFVVNMVMGVTRIPVLTFYITSQLAMLAATILFVFTGTQLSQINNMDDLLSPTNFMLFVLLGIFPLATKKAMSVYKNHRCRCQNE